MLKVSQNTRKVSLVYNEKRFASGCGKGGNIAIIRTLFHTFCGFAIKYILSHYFFPWSSHACSIAKQQISILAAFPEPSVTQASVETLYTCNI